MRAVFLANCLYHKKFEDRYFDLHKFASDIDVVAYDWKHGRSGGHRDIDYTPFYKVARLRFMSVVGRLVSLFLFFVSCLWLRILKGCKPDILIANSLEMAIVGQLVFPGAARKVFDLADINPAQTEGGVVSRLFVWLERKFVSDWIYVVTSPWFYWSFLIPVVGVKTPCYLIENKISVLNSPVKFGLHHYNKSKIVILWNGILRCNNSAIFLNGLLEAAKGRLELRLAGDYSLIAPDVLKVLLENESVVDLGAYSDTGLAEIFMGVDFCWAADLIGDFNSYVLLPNRIYQSVYYGTPLLSVGVSAISSVLNARGIGFAPESATPDEFFKLLCELSEDDYFGFRLNCEKISPKCIRANEWFSFFNNDLSPLPPVVDMSVVYG